MQTLLTITTFRERLGEENYILVADPRRTGTVDETKVQRAIDDATSYVWGKVQAGQHKLPRNVVPDVLVGLAFDLAVYKVCRFTGAGMTDDIREGYKAARQDCADLASRELMLGEELTAEQPSAGDAPIFVATGGPRQFERSKTGGAL
jgi:phage gp36-like protein